MSRFYYCTTIQLTSMWIECNCYVNHTYVILQYVHKHPNSQTRWRPMQTMFSWSNILIARIYVYKYRETNIYRVYLQWINTCFIANPLGLCLSLSFHSILSRLYLRIYICIIGTGVCTKLHAHKRKLNRTISTCLWNRAYYDSIVIILLFWWGICAICVLAYVILIIYSTCLVK